MKGIIAQIKDNEAVLINEKGEFIKIKNKNIKSEQKKYQNSNRFRYISSIAASFILLFALTYTGLAVYNTPTTYVSVDINPSMQLEINRFHKVINVVPFNEDAKTVLKSINIEHKNINQTINTIVDAAKELGFLTVENNHVEIDVISNVSDEDILKEKITKNMDKYVATGVDVTVDDANKDELALSKKLGVSLGRIKVAEEYTVTFGGDLKGNINNLSDITVGNIKKTIHADKNKATEQEETQDKENDASTETKSENKTEDNFKDDPANQTGKEDNQSSDSEPSANIKNKSESKTEKESKNETDKTIKEQEKQNNNEGKEDTMPASANPQNTKDVSGTSHQDESDNSIKANNASDDLPKTNKEEKTEIKDEMVQKKSDIKEEKEEKKPNIEKENEGKKQDKKSE